MITISDVGIKPTNGEGYSTSGGSGNRIADITEAQLIIDCLLTLSANYGGAASHGDTIPFSAIASPPNLNGYAPVWAEFWEIVPAGTAVPGFKYTLCPGGTLAAPTLAGSVLNIAGAGAGAGQGNQEITEGGAYANTTPSLNNQVVKARFYFVRQ